MKPTQAKRYHDDGMAVTPRPQLVIKLYERLMEDLSAAESAIVEKQIEQTHRSLIHAQDIVFELSLALDIAGWAGAQALHALYQHLDAKLIEANLHKSTGSVQDCVAIVSPLLDAWRDALVETQSRTMAAVSTTGSRGSVTA